MRDLEDVKKDFEIFGKGIQRLKEIKKELKSLNTKGHEKEVKAIEPNLKNVSTIPEVEKQLEDLKRKIAGKSRKPAKRRARLINIEKQISELKDLVKHKHRLVTKSLSKDELEDIHEIPKIDAAINEIKDTLQTLSNRRGPISKKYLKHINEIPKIEQHLAELKSEIEKRSKRIPSSKIDSDAGLVVQKYFNGMLLNIKYEFSNILKAKKKALEDKNNLELKRKEQELEEKHKALIHLYSKKYHNKVETELKKDVDTRFKDALDEKIKIEKGLLQKRQDKILQYKKEELTKKIDENLRIGERKLNKDFQNKLRLKNKDLKKQSDLELKNKEQELEEKHKSLIQFYIEKYNNKVETQLKKDVDTRFKDMLDKEISKKKSLIEKKYNKKFQEKTLDMNRKLNEELETKENTIIKEFRKKLNENIKLQNKKEATIKENHANLEKNLKKGFEDKENKLKASFSRALKNEEGIFKKKLENTEEKIRMEYENKLEELSRQVDVLKNKESALKDSYSRALKNKEGIFKKILKSNLEKSKKE